MNHHQEDAADGSVNRHRRCVFTFLKTMAMAIAVAIAVAIVAVIIAVITILAIKFLNSRNKTHIYLQDVYVPSLVNGTVNGTTTFNTSVFVDLKFERKAALARHRYGGFQMTLTYGRDMINNFSVGAHVVPGFNMGWKRRVHKKVAVEAVRMPWKEASRVVSDGKAVAMVVAMVSSHHKWDEAVLLGPVTVDASGYMVSKKPIEFVHSY